VHKSAFSSIPYDAVGTNHFANAATILQLAIFSNAQISIEILSRGNEMLNCQSQREAIVNFKRQ
jgi:hypothetical protein